METRERTSEHFGPSVTGKTVFAGFWARFAASLIDWIICFYAPLLALSFAVSKVDNLPWALNLIAILFVPSCFLGYFTYFVARGQSLGMSAVKIRIVNPKTGRPPGVGRALVRSFLALVGGLSPIVALLIFVSGQAQEINDTENLIMNSSVIVFGIAVLGRLWMIWDPKKQTPQDKLVGVIVVGKTGP